MTPALQVQPLCGWVSTLYTYHRGKRLGPYYVRKWKKAGRVHCEYIKHADLERVRAACQANRERRQRGIKIAADFYNTAGNLKWLTRMTRRSEKGALRTEDYEHIDRIEANGYSTPGRTKLRNPKPFRPQYPTPNTQHLNLERSFMYPHSTNHVFCHPERVPESRDLTGNTSCVTHDNRSVDANMNHLPLSTLNALRKETKRAFASQFATETIEEKWERWRKDHAQRPAPRPLPKARVDLAIPLDHVDAMTENLCQRLDESLAAGKSPPDWRKPISDKPVGQSHHGETPLLQPAPPAEEVEEGLAQSEAPGQGWSSRRLVRRSRTKEEGTKHPSNPATQQHSRAPRPAPSSDRSFSDELRRLKENNDAT